ncbi:Bax inhibitor-1/YccA family protein [Flavobacteriaceae bacterium]|nr:Bax inhibitor-1/YccA family protein [Flavobacteriaceae bacterium]
MQQLYTQQGELIEVQKAFMQKVYTWMVGALTITGSIAYVISSKTGLIESIYPYFTLLVIAQLGVVIFLSARINKMTSSTAFILFTLYSVLNGVTFSVIFEVYTASSIASTFFVTAGTFAAMSMYGWFTKKDLTSMGSFLYMALIGLIIASVVNMFFASSVMYWVITYAGVLIFVGLTAYDTQKIKKMSVEFHDNESHNKGAVIGALTLYLDFINLFLYLLRILGNRN